MNYPLTPNHGIWYNNQQREILELENLISTDVVDGWQQDGVYVNMFQDGGAYVLKSHTGFQVYEIPLYGGEPCFYKEVNTVDEVMDIAYNHFT